MMLNGIGKRWWDQSVNKYHNTTHSDIYICVAFTETKKSVRKA